MGFRAHFLGSGLQIQTSGWGSEQPYRTARKKPTCQDVHRNRVTYKKLFRGNLPSKHSPDSSGSPLLCVGNGDAAATADSGTQMGRVEDIGSLKEL